MSIGRLAGPALVTSTWMRLKDKDETKLKVKIEMQPVMATIVSDDDGFSTPFSTQVLIYPRTGLESDALAEKMETWENFEYDRAVDLFTGELARVRKRQAAARRQQERRARLLEETGFAQGWQQRRAEAKEEAEAGGAQLAGDARFQYITCVVAMMLAACPVLSASCPECCCCLCDCLCLGAPTLVQGPQ